LYTYAIYCNLFGHLVIEGLLMSEAPVRETSKKVLSPINVAILQLVQGVLPALTAILGGLWVVFTYLDHQQTTHKEELESSIRDTRIRLLEARKPFIDKQLSLYIEVTQLAGKLISNTPDLKEEWKEDYRRFEQLYWAELVLVEDDGVRAAMQKFYTILKWANTQPGPVPDEQWRPLEESSSNLAQAVRKSIEASWELNLSTDLRVKSQ
jgi:hypothetical protein